jgi:hypothetical protein
MLALLANADDVMILESNEENIKITKKKLITRALSIGLMINEGKTKYMIIMRGN